MTGRHAKTRRRRWLRLAALAFVRAAVNVRHGWRGALLPAGAVTLALLAAMAALLGHPSA